MADRVLVHFNRTHVWPGPMTLKENLLGSVGYVSDFLRTQRRLRVFAFRRLEAQFSPCRRKK